MLRRDPDTGLTAPIGRALAIFAIPVVVLLFAVEAPLLRAILGTVSLAQTQWATVIGLSVLVPVIIEAEKWVRRRRAAAAKPLV